MLVISLLLFIALVAGAGYLLGRSRDTQQAGSAQSKEQALIERVNALLPQTQCGQCEHPGCRPYAEAIVRSEQPINRCPPGGTETIRDLAELLGRDVIPLNQDFGEEKPASVALIDEPNCIGCTLCIQACPVDAIVGASKQMHVIIESECTGCELCLPPCPVDCIVMLPPEQTLQDWTWQRPA